MSDKTKTRYSDEDLEAFKVMIDKKLVEAYEQLDDLKEQLTELNNSGDENRAGTFDDGASNWQREHLNKLASRQQRFVRDLEHALIRIKNKTYGVCSVTGKLIDKQRLMLVPHATKTVEGKTQVSGKSARKPISGGGQGLETEKGIKSKKAGTEDEYEIIDDSDIIKDFVEPTDDY
jgi:RNA polymerase-binding transcription factor DksA